MMCIRDRLRAAMFPLRWGVARWGGVAVACAWLALPGVGCHRIENPHPNVEKRHGLIFFNYIIDGSKEEEEVLRTMPGTSGMFAGADLRVLVPTNYIPEHVLDLFLAHTGARVSLMEYPVNSPRALDIFRSVEWVDLVLLPGEDLQTLRELGELRQLHPSRLPNFRRIDSTFIDEMMDMGVVFQVPYLWSVAGIAYNFADLDFVPRSWMELLMPNTNHFHHLSNHVSLLPDRRHFLSPALAAMGYDPGTTNPVEVAKAGAFLRRQIDAMGLKFMEVPPAEGLTNGTILMAECYSADIAPIINLNTRFKFSVPESGTWMKVESFAVPTKARAQRVALAETFINFMLEPRFAGEVSSHALRATTIGQARLFVHADVRNGIPYIHGSNIHAVVLNHESEELRANIWERINSGKE